VAFASGFIALTVGAAALAGWFPIEFSLATVFLFAGPHNWFEARYALGRLPARAGKLWGFFTVSALGIVGLAGAYAAVPVVLPLITDPDLAVSLYSVWSTVFVLWVAVLVWMRSRTNPRFDGGWVWPLALFICAGAWLNPFALPVVLVYLHPVMALVLLDRELVRSRPHWRRTYWCIIGCVLLALAVLWWRLHDAPEPTGASGFTVAFAPTLSNHAGAWFFDGVSPHFLIASHAFLEMVHYGIWVVLIPLIGMRSRPWQLTRIPAARRNRAWSRGVAGVLLFGALIVVTLWVCFGLDYQTTRHVYFTIAMLHVLAEVPFLLRMV
jgi:hypothetical protein